MTWELVYTKPAQKDAQKLAALGLKEKAQILLPVLRENPFQNPPPYEKLMESQKVVKLTICQCNFNGLRGVPAAVARFLRNRQKLVGDLSGVYSRRINIQHRLVYQVLKDQNVVKVLRMWSRYE